MGLTGKTKTELARLGTTEIDLETANHYFFTLVNSMINK